MRTRLLIYCLVFGIVSAVDDEPQRSVFIIPQNGLPPSEKEKSFFGSSVGSKSVKVLPNAYKTPSGIEPVTVPVEVNNNTPFQGNINQPIPVPVSYATGSEAPTEPSQLSNGIRSVSIQRTPNIPPIPILVKAPAFAPITSSPRPFEASVQFSDDNNLENPYSVKASSFRLWPKLPDPVPVPVLTSNAFLRKYYQNIFSRQNPNKPPIPDQTTPLTSFQLYPASRTTYSQNQAQSSPGPIYILASGAKSNAQSSYQPPQRAQPIYQFQSSQLENQQQVRNYIILASPSSSSQPAPNQDPSYLNNLYSSNQYLGSTSQSQSRNQPPLSNAIFDPSNTGTEKESQSSNFASQSPIIYAIAPPSLPRGQANSAGQTSPLIYAVAPASKENTSGQSPLIYTAVPSSFSGSQTFNPAGQSPLIYAVAPPKFSGNSANSASQSTLNYAAFPSNYPGSQTTNSGQSPLLYAVAPSSNTAGQSTSPYTAFPSSNSGGQSSNIGQPFIYAVDPLNVPGYVANSGRSGQSSTNYAVFAPSNNQSASTYYPSTPSTEQFPNYSQTTQSPQYASISSPSQLSAYNGLSGSTQSPLPQFYSSTPTSSDSPSTVSRVSVSGQGINYSYSL